jgi:hypothetical protein
MKTFIALIANARLAAIAAARGDLVAARRHVDAI